MADLYGHPRLYALRGSDGILCYRWYASDVIAVVLFTDAKTATKWVKEVKKLAAKQTETRQAKWEMAVQPHPITEHPEGLNVTINPAVDVADVARIMDRIIWQNW